MQVVSIILSVGLLGVIIYFAVSPKSSRPIKLTAIIALALISLALGVCGIMLIRGPSQAKVISLPFLPDDTTQPPAKKSNLAVILTFLVSFFFIVGLVLMTTMKEKQNKAMPQKKPQNTADSRIFEAAGELDIDHPDGEMEEKNEENEDSFEIGI